MNACETSRPLSRRARLEASDNTKCKPSMLGVGLEIPNFRAETPLLMSLATILTLTLVSLLYADTQRLGITRMFGFFFFNASTSAWPITFPAPHFSKLAISSFMPSKPKSALSCINELSSITSSGFHTKTLVPPSFTFTQVWSRSGMNLIEFNSSSNNSGLVATARSGPASRLHKTGPTDWHASSIKSKSRVMGCPEALSRSISASNSSTGCSASLLVPPVSSTSIST